MANMPGGDCTASTGLNTTWADGAASYSREPDLAWLRNSTEPRAGASTGSAYKSMPCSAFPGPGRWKVAMAVTLAKPSGARASGSGIAYRARTGMGFG
jgi:hypothetical protein